MSEPHAADGARILLVEDDRDMATALRRNFEREGYVVTTAGDGESALQLARREDPDLIVLDVMLPRLDGFRVLRTLRAEGSEVPVLMLTARSTEADKVFGFRAGADDYLTKPFGLQELLARVAALLRRASRQRDRAEPAGERIAFGTVEIDPDTRTVRRDGVPVPLTPKAYELLLTLVRHRGATVARETLMREVWGYRQDVTSRTLDAHVAELRRKLEPDSSAPRFIRTVWRIGYRFEADGAAEGDDHRA